MLMKLLLLVLTTICCLFCGNWLVENPGSVQIIWLGNVVETSVSFCIFLILTILLFLYLILFPFRWLDKIRAYLNKKTSEKAQILLGQILTNIFCQTPQNNTKPLKELEKTGKISRGVMLILKAKSSYSKEVFEELTQNPITEQIGWCGLIDGYIEKGEMIKACELVETLIQKDAKPAWLLNRALNLFVLNGQWQRAYECLEKLFKQKQISKNDYLYKKANLLIKMNKGEEAFETCPDLPQAAILAAEQKTKKAQNIYLKSWANTPSWDVYKAYVKLFAKENTLSQFKHVEKLCQTNKNAKLNDLVMADAAINAKLWSEAKRFLNGYLAMYPLTMGVAAQMALIESEANHNLKDAQLWIEKASTAIPDTEYVCTKCAHKTNVWGITCPACNHFAGLKAK